MSHELLAELAEWIAIPSVSADPAHAGDVAGAGDWLVEKLRAAGGEAERIDWHGQPLVIGEIAASGSHRAATVLCYGHFDVQSPDPLELWESEPFSLSARDGWLYGRGVADDKGQLMMLLEAARSLAREGALPVNVRFVCDGEEEIGGHSIADFLAADERGADACLIFDTSMIERDVPAFTDRDARPGLLPSRARKRRARPPLRRLRRRRSERSACARRDTGGRAAGGRPSTRAAHGRGGTA